MLAQKTVTYDVGFPNAIHHEAEVRATFSGFSGTSLSIVMSRSSPGRYALAEFAKNVYHFRAFDSAGRPAEIERPDPYTWVLTGVRDKVTITYTLFADFADGTYAAVDQTHAHLNMPALLAWAKGFEQAPATLHFEIPPGSNWKIATQLIPHEGNAWTAPNLEWLMDSPVEISAHDSPEFKIENATFRLALHHRGTPEQAAAYAEMCRAVVLEEEGVFGEFPHYDGGTYTFLLDYLPYVSPDGMEHRDSTGITGRTDLKDSAARAIGTVSHEFFHSWNVKRIRPRSLEPFDFERVNMSGELWFAEGFTNYYGPLTLERASISTQDDFFKTIGSAVNFVLNAPGRTVHNVVDMSRLAPFVDAATYIDRTNFPNTYISYYVYGEALALGIDLAIREHFPGKSLDDWMRSMWRAHPDIDKPYTLADLQSTLAEATGSAEFASTFFDHHIYGLEPMEYRALLEPAGLLLQLAHPGRAWVGSSPRVIGFSLDSAEVIASTLRDSPLYLAGLDVNDRILEWDGKKLGSQQDLDKLLSSHKPGDSLRLKVDTRAGNRIVTVICKEDPALEIIPFEKGRPVTPAIESFRKSWLRSKALHPLPQIPAMP